MFIIRLYFLIFSLNMLDSCQNIFNLRNLVVKSISRDIICTFFKKHTHAFTHIIVGIWPTSLYRFAVNELTMRKHDLLSISYIYEKAQSHCSTRRRIGAMTLSFSLYEEIASIKKGNLNLKGDPHSESTSGQNH